MVDKETILKALRRVIDPELDLNIVDLGLIYDVQVSNGDVDVTMTLTTPGCPLHAAIARGAKAAVRNVAGVQQANVQIVWDPPWTPERMSDEAKAHLRWG